MIAPSQTGGSAIPVFYVYDQNAGIEFFFTSSTGNSALLSHRIFSAVFIVGTILALIYLDVMHPIAGQPGLWLVPAMFFLSVGTAWEFSVLTQSTTRLSPWLGTVSTFFVLIVSMIPMVWPVVRPESSWSFNIWGRGPVLEWICMGILFGLMISAIVVLFSSRKAQANPLVQWSVLSLITLYCGGLAAMWIAIRLQRAPSEALLALVGISTVVKCSDAGAYFVGKGYGKTKLCPHISPGKTVEGALGGFAIATIVSIVYFQLFVPNTYSHSFPPFWGPAAIGFALGIVGLIGDLVESMIKRVAGAKDSGRLLPGLGGIWDVTDSLLPTTVVGYLGMVAGWI